MKKLFTIAISLCFISSTVNASSSHGDFEGSPIVSVQSNGTDLKTEDVPAINYKGRTMVPIYMLKQLGADVVWNDSTYSVNVNVKEKIVDTPAKQVEDDKAKEVALLKDIYKWLSDTDMAMWMFVVKLQQYINSDSTTNQDYFNDTDYTELNDLYNESLKFFFDNISNIKSENHLTEIAKKQADALAQIGQSKDLLKIWLTQKSSSQIKDSLKVSLSTSLTMTQQSFVFTNKCLHELIAKKYLNNMKQP